MNDDGVRLLLITGDDDQLFHFHLHACHVLNGVERRKQTVCYACMNEHFEWAVDLARRTGVEIREIVIEGESPGRTSSTRTPSRSSHPRSIGDTGRTGASRCS